MIIVAIDPGIKNLGWSVYDSSKNIFLSFGRYNLLKDQPKNMHTKYAFLVKSFVESCKDVFEAADKICIEIQMVAKFKVIATAFQCFFWDRSELVSPRSVRCHFKISTGNYTKNKKASIAIVPKLDIPLKNKRWFNTFDKKKRDDVADAMLIALYWAEKGQQKKEKEEKKKDKKRKRTTQQTKSKRRRVYKKEETT